MIDACPSSLQAKSQRSETPLYLAVSLGRLDIVKMLLAAGADQTCKDEGWRNLLHGALSKNLSVGNLKSMLDLLDRNLLPHMLKERSHFSHGGRTPIHDWVQRATASSYSPTYNAGNIVEMLQLLFSIDVSAAQHALTMLDGAGNTILHTLITQAASPDVVRAVLDFSPALLFRENSVGRTPAELARDQFVRDMVTRMPIMQYERPSPVGNMVDNVPETFVDCNAKSRPGLDDNERSVMAKTWDLCAEVLARTGTDEQKRRLVSLHEASDDERRVGEGDVGSWYGVRGSKLRLGAGSPDRGGGEGGQAKEEAKKKSDITMR